MRIPLKKINIKKNIRNDNDESIPLLAESIKSLGLMNPLTVREGKNGTYELIAGHRRFRAVSRLGWEEVDCNVVENLAAKNIPLMQFAENIQRKAMTPQEAIDTIEKIKELYGGLTDKQAAKVLHVSQAWVSNQRVALKFLTEKYGPDKVPERLKGASAAKILGERLGDRQTYNREGFSVTVKGHHYSVTCFNGEIESRLRALLGFKNEYQD